MNRHFQAKLIKYQRLHIMETTATIPIKFLCSDKYYQIFIMGGSNMHITIPRWRMATILKKKLKNYNI